ncbi:hypothetical protein [Bacillus subtilis]|uniref:hypothetical protein n=1 Tax=Bacillus subtilis TaxID=1423 RepID=UPI004034158C
MNFDLYEGGGVILFLALLGKENGKKEYFDLALAGMRGIEELFLSDDKSGCPVITIYRNRFLILYILPLIHPYK